MATVPFMIERKVHYHGIWNTLGLQVSDQFLKSIAEQYMTKPSCPSFLTLSSSAVSLTVFKASGEALREDNIAMDVLREIAVNAFDPRCLMILYVNSKSKYSVIVCSCLDEKEAMKISVAYKQLKNLKLVNREKQLNSVKQNWILRQNPRDSVKNGTTSSADSSRTNTLAGRGRTVSGIMNDTFAFLNNEDDDDDLFGQDVVRVPVHPGLGGNDSFHVGLQVSLEDASNAGSLSSRSSMASLQSMSESFAAMLMDEEPVTQNEIGTQEFFKTVKATELSNGVHNGDCNGNAEAHGALDEETTPVQHRIKTDGSDDDHDHRSIGTQTMTFATRRYKKRPGSMNSSRPSNIYKEINAHKKQTPTASQATTATQQATSAQADVQLRTRPHTFNTGVSYKSLFLPRQVHVSSTSVSKPIENVYHSLPRRKHVRTRGSLGRRVVLHSPKHQH